MWRGRGCAERRPFVPGIFKDVYGLCAKRAGKAYRMARAAACEDLATPETQPTSLGSRLPLNRPAGGKIAIAGRDTAVRSAAQAGIVSFLPSFVSVPAIWEELGIPNHVDCVDFGSAMLRWV